MIQCEDCEFFERGPSGANHFLCDPFTNIKESECLIKWQLIKLDVIAKSHEATLQMHERMAPLQEKMIRHLEREIGEADEADSWKYNDEDDEDEDQPLA